MCYIKLIVKTAQFKNPLFDDTMKKTAYMNCDSPFKIIDENIDFTF